MSTNKLRIVAAIVDTQQMTVYKEDGTTISYSQGDPKIRIILDQAMGLSRGESVVEITFPEEVMPENAYKQFEDKSSGIVKFFRIAKKALTDFFKAADPVEPISLGSANLDSSEEDDDTVVEPLKTVPPSMASAVDEIMRHATPVSHDKFTEEDVVKQSPVLSKDSLDAHAERAHLEKRDNAASHTIVAVVNNKVIPGVEMIKSQLDRAAKTGSTKGVELFMQRIASVDRRHSAADLLKFMERGDLPIADDGSIVIYKVLKRHPSIEDAYVDCHTQKVTQRVGSYVFMDVSLVDHNRSTECSNGLHVARRNYVSGFSGDLCVIAKVAPEDVIAVPTYDANKMRVCGYHILHELSPSQYSKLKRNQAITDDDAGQKLLANILAGIHVDKIEMVQITQHGGNGVVITPVDKSVNKTNIPPDIAKAALTGTPVDKPVTPVGLALADSGDEAVADKPVDPKEVSKQVAAVVQQTALTKKEQALAIYARIAIGSTETDSVDAATELVAFKKASKKGWGALGLTDQQGFDVMNVALKASE